jgi:hypothetical protein
MMILIYTLAWQAVPVALPAPDALQAYSLCVYRMAEVRVNQPTDQAISEALLLCENGPLLDAAVDQVISSASGSEDARGPVAAMVKRHAEFNALSLLNRIRPQL